MKESTQILVAVDAHTRQELVDRVQSETYSLSQFPDSGIHQDCMLSAINTLREYDAAVALEQAEEEKNQRRVTPHLEIVITRHPDAGIYAGLSEHKVAIVTTRRGLVYACTYAPADEPLTLDVVHNDWRHCRKAFRPYDTSTGHYC